MVKRTEVVKKVTESCGGRSLANFKLSGLVLQFQAAVTISFS